MAYIEKRGEKWRVLIRKRGRAPISRTFRLKAQAERWAREIEVAIESEDAGRATRGACWKKKTPRRRVGG